jgi:hypothetical protein
MYFFHHYLSIHELFRLNLIFYLYTWMMFFFNLISFEFPFWDLQLKIIEYLTLNINTFLNLFFYIMLLSKFKISSLLLLFRLFLKCFKFLLIIIKLLLVVLLIFGFDIFLLMMLCTGIDLISNIYSFRLRLYLVKVLLWHSLFYYNYIS